MGAVAALRQIDFVAALRGWSDAEARYRACGLEVGEPASVTGDPTAYDAVAAHWEPKRHARERARAVEAAFVRGDDEAAFALLDALWPTIPGDTILDALHWVATRRTVLATLERTLPSLQNAVPRLVRLREWLDAASHFDLGPALRGEAKGMTASRRPRLWMAKALQSRAMDAWARAYDTTNGFTAPPARIAFVLETLGGEEGYSRTLLSISLPVLAQGIEGVQKLADRQGAVRDLVDAMVVHAETGRWPEGVATGVCVTRGDESAHLPLEG